MILLLTALLLLVGAAFTLLAALGLWRLEDFFLRMQAATKASTLGVSCMAIAVALHFGDLATTITAGLVAGFLFLTAPVASHVIGRAAYLIGVPMLSDTVDEWRRDREKPSGASLF